MFKYTKKILSLVLIVSFILTSAIPSYGFNGRTLFTHKSHAQRYLKDKEALTNIIEAPFLLDIPQSMGRIVETYKGKSDSLIIHIQDRHIDQTAQSNISSIIEQLNTKYNVNLMCLEGASEELDTSFYDKYEAGPAKEKVAGLFMQQGLFTGAELYKINNADRYLKAVGAENKQAYLAHLDCYKKNQIDKDAVLKLLNSLGQGTDKLKQIIYTKGLKAIDSLSGSYKGKSINLSEYLAALKKYSKKAKIDIAKYQDLEKFIQLTEDEKHIDFKKAEEEREHAIRLLSEDLDEADAKELVRMSMDFRLNRISDIAFYEYFQALLGATDCKITAKDYKNLTDYIDYLKFSKTINHLNVFDQADSLEEEIQAALCKDPVQKQLLKYAKAIGMLKDLYELKLAHRHLDYMDENKENFDIVKIQQFLKETSARYGLGIEPYTAESRIDKESLEHSKEFYRLALKRDIALTENTINNLKKYRKKKAILVTGGFHTQGITNILKEKDISYIVICPNIGLDDCEEIYSERMQGVFPSIETLKELLVNMLSTPLYTGDAAGKAASAGVQELFGAIHDFVLGEETAKPRAETPSLGQSLLTAEAAETLTIRREEILRSINKRGVKSKQLLEEEGPIDVFGTSQADEHGEYVFVKVASGKIRNEYEFVQQPDALSIFHILLERDKSPVQGVDPIAVNRHNLSRETIEERLRSGVVIIINPALLDKRFGFKLGGYSKKKESMQERIPGGIAAESIAYVLAPAGLAGLARKAFDDRVQIITVDEKDFKLIGFIGEPQVKAPDFAKAINEVLQREPTSMLIHAVALPALEDLEKVDPQENIYKSSSSGELTPEEPKAFSAGELESAEVSYGVPAAEAEPEPIVPHAADSARHLDIRYEINRWIKRVPVLITGIVIFSLTFFFGTKLVVSTNILSNLPVEDSDMIIAVSLLSAVTSIYRIGLLAEKRLYNNLVKNTRYVSAELTGRTVLLHVIKNSNELQVKRALAYRLVAREARRVIFDIIQRMDQGEKQVQGIRYITAKSHLLADQRHGKLGMANPVFQKELEQLGITIHVVNMWKNPLAVFVAKLFHGANISWLRPMEGHFVIDVSTPEKLKAFTAKIQSSESKDVSESPSSFVTDKRITEHEQLYAKAIRIAPKASSAGTDRDARAIMEEFLQSAHVEENTLNDIRAILKNESLKAEEELALLFYILSYKAFASKPVELDPEVARHFLSVCEQVSPSPALKRSAVNFTREVSNNISARVIGSLDELNNQLLRVGIYLDMDYESKQVVAGVVINEEQYDVTVEQAIQPMNLLFVKPLINNQHYGGYGGTSHRTRAEEYMGPYRPQRRLPVIFISDTEDLKALYNDFTEFASGAGHDDALHLMGAGLSLARLEQPADIDAFLSLQEKGFAEHELTHTLQEFLIRNNNPKLPRGLPTIEAYNEFVAYAGEFINGFTLFEFGSAIYMGKRGREALEGDIPDIPHVHAVRYILYNLAKAIGVRTDREITNIDDITRGLAQMVDRLGPEAASDKIKNILRNIIKETMPEGQGQLLIDGLKELANGPVKTTDDGLAARFIAKKSSSAGLVRSIKEQLRGQNEREDAVFQWFDTPERKAEAEEIIAGIDSPDTLLYDLSEERFMEALANLIIKRAEIGAKSIRIANALEKTSSAGVVNVDNGDRMFLEEGDQRTLKAGLEVCLAVVGYKINSVTGQSRRVMAHFLPHGHIEISRGLEAGGLQAAKELYLKRLLNGIEGAGWQIALVRSGDDFDVEWANPDSIISEEDLAGYLHYKNSVPKENIRRDKKDAKFSKIATFDYNGNIIMTPLKETDTNKPYSISLSDTKSSSAGRKILKDELGSGITTFNNDCLKILSPEAFSYINFGNGRITFITDVTSFAETDRKFLAKLNQIKERITIVVADEDARASLTTAGFIGNIETIDEYEYLADRTGRPWDMESMDNSERIAMIAADIRGQNRAVITVTDSTVATEIGNIMTANKLLESDRKTGTIVVASMNGATQQTQIGNDVIDIGQILFSVVAANGLKEGEKALQLHKDQQLYVITLPAIDSLVFEKFIYDLMQQKRATDAAASAA